MSPIAKAVGVCYGLGMEHIEDLWLEKLKDASDMADELARIVGEPDSLAACIADEIGQVYGHFLHVAHESGQ